MNKAAKIILPIVTLGVGAAIAIGLVKTRPKAKKIDPGSLTTAVETIRLAPQKETVRINAMGTVVASRQVVLNPEITGRIVWIDPRLVPGGHFEQGQTLARVDSRNYKLALDQQKANLQKAKFELEVERGRQRVAKREWELLDRKSNTGEDGQSLALRVPHLAYAEAVLAAAESAVERAELDLSRTAMRAPFNGFIQSESVEVGQLVGPSNTLATLVGTDEFWVQVSMPVDRIGWVKLPSEDAPGSPVTVVQDAGGGVSIERTGEVVRLLGDLDPRGRMARVVVSIKDPLGLEKGLTELPLLLGAYVRVAIEGNALDNVYAIPRTALYQGDSVLLADPKDELEIRGIEVAWRKADTVFVRAGLSKGDRLITSRVPYVLAGTKLEVREKPGRGSPRASNEDPVAPEVIDAEEGTR